MDKKDKVELIEKAASQASKYNRKEKRLYEKIIEKNIENWNENDIEFLNLLYDLHHFTPTAIGGMDIYPADQAREIQMNENQKKMKAQDRIKEEPFSLWFENLRNYK